MTGHDIEVNYTNARLQADGLRNEAEELRRVAKEYENTLVELGGIWTGKEAQQFVATARKHTGRMNQAVSRLNQLAQAIDKAAEAYRKAETQKLQAQN